MDNETSSSAAEAAGYRLDSTTWTLYQPGPGSVDAARDRAARRYLMAYWAWSWAWAVGVMVALLATMLDRLALIVLVGLFVVGPVVVVLILQRWRRLRREVGFPVIADLAQPVEIGAEIVGYYTEIFDLPLRSDLGAVQKMRAVRGERVGRGKLRMLTRQLLLQLDTAALAERWGWEWLRVRCGAKTVRLVEALVHAFQQGSKPGEDDTADAEAGASPDQSGDVAPAESE